MKTIELILKRANVFVLLVVTVLALWHRDRAQPDVSGSHKSAGRATSTAMSEDRGSEIINQKPGGNSEW